MSGKTPQPRCASAGNYTRAIPERYPGETIEGGAIGCRFCNALRELFTLDWDADRERFARLFHEGGCVAALPGPQHTRVETDGEFSAFVMLNPVYNPGPNGMPMMWFRNSDMRRPGG